MRFVTNSMLTKVGIKLSNRGSRVSAIGAVIRVTTRMSAMTASAERRSRRVEGRVASQIPGSPGRSACLSPCDTREAPRSSSAMEPPSHERDVGHPRRAVLQESYTIARMGKRGRESLRAEDELRRKDIVPRNNTWRLVSARFRHLARSGRQAVRRSTRPRPATWPATYA